VLGQELVTPVERCRQGLMPRRCGAPPILQKPNSIVQEYRQLPYAKGVDTGGRQFDRERHPFQLATEVGNDRRIRVVQFEPIQFRRRALDEKLDGGESKSFRSRQLRRVWRKLQRRQAVQALTLCAQRLTTGCQDLDSRGTAQDLFR